jgi:hypothetical protein
LLGYDALEIGKIDLDELSPRIKALKARQTELEISRAKLEAEMANRGIEQVNVAEVKKHVGTCVNCLLNLTSPTEKPSCVFRQTSRDRRQVGHGSLQVAVGGWR